MEEITLPPDLARDVIRLQERVRIFESTVNEIRSDIKEIKTSVQISAMSTVQKDASGKTWSKLFEPAIVAFWAIIGALLTVFVQKGMFH